MEKNFDRWNEEKKKTDANQDYLPLYYEREIRWCRLGVNIGFEQDGTGENFSRPVLVLKGFSRNVCLAIPLTTSTKKNPYHVPLGKVEGREAFAIISQIRLIDTRRLDQQIGVVDKAVFAEIKRAVKRMLDDSPCSPSCEGRAEAICNHMVSGDSEDVKGSGDKKSE